MSIENFQLQEGPGIPPKPASEPRTATEILKLKQELTASPQDRRAEEEAVKPMTDAVESMLKSALDTQVAGDHYRKLGAYQPWEVLRRWLTPEEFRGYMKGNAIVYLAREQDKGGSVDVEKAMHTLQGMLELEKRDV